MHDGHVVINGSENSVDISEPLISLIQFYKAFNEGSLSLMRKNWLNDPSVSMANPLGEIRKGWVEIEHLYSSLFSGPITVYVEFYDFSVYCQRDTFLAVGRERGHCSIDGSTIELAIRTSRFYVRRGGCWKQLHHHGSIDNPKLLQDYQTAVRNYK